MDIPPATTDNTLFSLQTARDFLTALQAKEPSSSTAVDFNQVLDSANSITDTFGIGPIDQAVVLDPTVSALFQAHSGTIAASQTGLVFSDAALLVEHGSQLKVTGIDASSAAGPFANGQNLQAEQPQVVLGGLEATESSRYPGIAGAGEFSGIYNALRSAGQMNPPIGTRLDLQG